MAVRWEKDFSVVARITGRGQGDMKKPPVWARALRRAGGTAGGWAGGHQVHGVRVRRATAPTAPGEHPATDGLWTERPGLALRVFSADCVPVFLVDPAGPVALLHAGWRGVRAGILTRAVSALRRRHPGFAARVHATIGPHLRPCCYEIGPDVAAAFKSIPGAVRRRRGTPGKFTLSLETALRHEARRLGLRRFSAAPWCTACDTRFFSYRRDKTEHRQAALLARRPEPKDGRHGQTTR